MRLIATRVVMISSKHQVELIHLTLQHLYANHTTYVYLCVMECTDFRSDVIIVLNCSGTRFK